LHNQVSWLKSWFPRFVAIVEGTPMVLLDQGVWREEGMHGG
jgi:uncharacterized membrane protein YcaP (DUF421 family)